MHVSKMVYITRWKEAGSYQHGDCFPHTSGQTGQDVTGILLVGSSSRYISLHFPLQQHFWKGNQIFSRLLCYTWKLRRSAGRAWCDSRSWQYWSWTRARRCRKRGSPWCPPPNLYMTENLCKNGNVFFFVTWSGGSLLIYSSCNSPGHCFHHLPLGLNLPGGAQLLFHSTTESAEHIDYQQVNSGKTISQTDHSCALLSITALQLARSCSGWKETQIRKYWRTFWEISVTAAAAKWLWQLAIHWKADYMAAYCNYARNSAGEMWFAAPGEIQLKKVTQ